MGNAGRLLARRADRQARVRLGHDRARFGRHLHGENDAYAQAAYILAKIGAGAGGGRRVAHRCGPHARIRGSTRGLAGRGARPWRSVRRDSAGQHPDPGRRPGRWAAGGDRSRSAQFRIRRRPCASASGSTTTCRSARIRRWRAPAEAAGFDQFWVSDDLFLRSVWVILSAVAQATQRIEIGTCIVNPYTLHPAEMAMAAGALDEIAHGPAVPGLVIRCRGLSQLGGYPRRTPADRRRRDRLEAAQASSPASRPTSTARSCLAGPPKRTCAFRPARSRSTLARWARGCSARSGGSPTAACRCSFRRAFATPWLHSRRTRRRTVARPGRRGGVHLVLGRLDDREAAENALRDKDRVLRPCAEPDHSGARSASTRRIRADPAAIMVDRDLLRARALVTPAMLRIGVVGTAGDLIPRLEGLVAMGARHLSFGPPLGPIRWRRSSCSAATCCPISATRNHGDRERVRACPPVGAGAAGRATNPRDRGPRRRRWCSSAPG